MAAMQQWRLRTVGAGNMIVTQPHGLDMAAIAIMAPAYGLAVDQTLFEKLRAFELACLFIWSGAKRCSKQRKANCEFKFGDNLEWACGKCPENPKRGKG